MLGVVLPAQGASLPVIVLSSKYRLIIVFFLLYRVVANPEKLRKGGMVGRPTIV